MCDNFDFDIVGMKEINTPDADALVELISKQTTHVQFICSLGKFIWDDDKQGFILHVDKQTDKQRHHLLYLEYDGDPANTVCRRNRKELLYKMIKTLSSNGDFTIKVKIRKEDTSVPNRLVVTTTKYIYTIPYTATDAISIMAQQMMSNTVKLKPLGYSDIINTDDTEYSDNNDTGDTDTV